MPKRSRSYERGLLEDLQDPIRAAHYVNAAWEESDEMFLLALRDVAEARRMAKVAEEAGLSRESIYRTLSNEGNPRLSSLSGILKALKLRIKVEAEEAEECASENASDAYIGDNVFDLDNPPVELANA